MIQNEKIPFLIPSLKKKFKNSNSHMCSGGDMCKQTDYTYINIYIYICYRIHFKRILLYTVEHRHNYLGLLHKCECVPVTTNGRTDRVYCKYLRKVHECTPLAWTRLLSVI